MFKELGVFFKSWLRSPLQIGAIFPSSRDLAKAIVEQIPDEDDGLIIELGAGTGAITQALLDSGIDPQRLIIIERDDNFFLYLKKKFPELLIINGSAEHLEELLDFKNHRVQAIVSSLPFMSMKQFQQWAIIKPCFRVLGYNAPFIQFTYSFSSPLPYKDFNLSAELKKRVFTNFPPASIWVYKNLYRNI
ncbi:MAG: methyltransferase [Alphaproteobacteria bacterium]|nr:methyltransferase [Alphaproteobacteria bacterium]